MIIFASVPPPLVSEDLGDLMRPGVVLIVDPADADRLGAFEEPALSEADAWDANADVEAGDGE